MHQGLRDNDGLRILDWKLRRKERGPCRHFGSVWSCSIREDKCTANINGTLDLIGL